MEIKAHYKVSDLADYISFKYQRQFEKQISSIKLQKSLYFLFAYWGGFASKGLLKPESIELKTEHDGELYPYLFSEPFEAWTYGPVVKEIYQSYNMKQLFGNDTSVEVINDIISQYPIVKSFIDDLLEDIFKVSDFKLVDIAHQDECWKNNYNEKDDRHNNIIPAEEIINEYTSKI